jgi:hypothetical protein
LPGLSPRRSSGAGQGQCEGVRHVPQRVLGASLSASPRTGRCGAGFPGESGSSAAVLSAARHNDGATPGRRWRLGRATRWKSAVDGEGGQHTGRGPPPATAQLTAPLPRGSTQVETSLGVCCQAVLLIFIAGPARRRRPPPARSSVRQRRAWPTTETKHE